MNILLCDDSSFMRRMLKVMLEDMGQTIVGEAGNGKEALDRYKALKPDIVFMDITMPEVDGLHGVKMIMESDANASVIMCSAMGQKGIVTEAVKYGAKDFIVKPFNREAIHRAICGLRK